MSLFDLQLPEPETSTPLPQTDYVVTLKTTRTGRPIMVCTAPIAPPEVVAEADAKGLPLFTAGEIVKMRDCLPEMVEQILAAKRTFPGCTVQQILSGDVQA
jgi:hypothetical protein